MEEIPENKIEKRASDAKLTEFLSFHIDNPCETQLYDGQVVNIRDFYIREAERILPTFTDMEAKKKLQEKIDQYRNK